MTSSRRSIRLKNYDYSQNGAYFVTICTKNRECLLGEISADEMILNDFGRMVMATWNDLPNHISGIELDEFVVMPNHLHAIIIIVGAVDPDRAGLDPDRAGLEPAPTGKMGLPEIVRQLKTFSARRINKIRESSLPVWQRNYYEHIIRDVSSLNRIREYIYNNPLNWELDENNPACQHAVKSTDDIISASKLPV